MSVPSVVDRVIRGCTPDEERIYEANIVIQLDSGSALYCDRLERLYFFDAADKQIGAAITAVLRGAGHEAAIQPVELDQHRYMAVGHKVQLSDAVRDAVFSALALMEVTVGRLNSGGSSRAAGTSRTLSTPGISG